MKRSQMIEKIYDLLNCDGVLEYSMPKTESVNLTESHLRNIAKWCLETVEDEGMLPPHVTEQVKTSVVVAHPMGYQELIVEDSKAYVSRWEDET